jgi:hypothetical protein
MQRQRVALRQRSANRIHAIKIMKTTLIFSATIFVAVLASAQTSQLGGITNQSGQTFTTEEIQNQLEDLHRSVEETMPILTAVTQTYSNSAAQAKPTVAGGIANVLGGLLNRNTNNTGQASPARTNTLGRILQGVLSATMTTNAPAANAAEFRDVAALQEHLQAMRPILQRLGVATNSQPASVGGTGDGSTIERGQNRRDT